MQSVAIMMKRFYSLILSFVIVTIVFVSYGYSDTFVKRSTVDELTFDELSAIQRRSKQDYSNFIQERSFGTSVSSNATSTLASATVAPTPIPTKHTIEVGYPYIPGPYYGEPVASSLIFEHTFGNSYGQPFGLTFNPPSGDIVFNRVVLTLNTSVTDYQYDRLAHVYINDAEVWRTSTIEPAGNKSIIESTYSKDVSSYLSLFKSSSFLKFDLGNIVSSIYQGEFDVQLHATYYFVDEDSSNDTPFNIGDSIQVVSDSDSFGDVFSIAKPASRVYPISPTKYLPQDTIDVKLPNDIPQNTTRLLLSVFASGNSAEEFWYTNAFSEYETVFGDDSPMPGYGPARIVKVYYNGNLVAVQSPQPFIFTGGISPSLWNPLVANNAFDLPSIDIDLTALLPEISSDDDGSFIIEVTNTTSPSPSVGSDWIVSANLLTYEHESVVKSHGSIVSISNIEEVSPSDNVPGDGTLNQYIEGEFNAQLISNVNFELKDGSEVRTLIKSSTKAKVTNSQFLGGYANFQTVNHLGKSDREVFIADINSAEVYYNHRYSFKYPITLSMGYANNTIPTGWSADTSVNITLEKDVTVSYNGNDVYHSNVKEVGTSIFSQTNHGNHGFGDTSSNYQVTQSAPFPLLDYDRTVQGINNTIVSDEVSGGLASKKRFVANENDPVFQNHKRAVEPPVRGTKQFEHIALRLDPIFVN